MRPRRLLSKVVAAAFLLMAMQQLVAVPIVRESARIEQRLARTSTRLKWREVVPAPAVAELPELAAVLPLLHPPAPQSFSTEALGLRRFQRPPPAL